MPALTATDFPIPNDLQDDDNVYVRYLKLTEMCLMLDKRSLRNSIINKLTEIVRTFTNNK
jgi:hypothetical protein